MMGGNEICVNEQEMCRLIQIALKADVIRDGVPFDVVKVEEVDKSGYGEKRFKISIAEPVKPEVPA